MDTPGCEGPMFGLLLTACGVMTIVVIVMAIVLLTR
jgi:hypothetical protein